MFRDAVIPEVKIITPKKHVDARGFVSEVYKQSDWRAAGLDIAFVQDIQTYSPTAGTLRGLHFQMEPAAQGKLIRVVRGRVLDVAVDIRRSSPTFGQHVAHELSASNWKQMFVPTGFAHGFITLEPDTEVIYKVTNPYSPAHDRGLAWDDPDLGINWQSRPDLIFLSERDRSWPRLRNLSDTFY